MIQALFIYCNVFAAEQLNC